MSLSKSRAGQLLPMLTMLGIAKGVSRKNRKPIWQPTEDFRGNVKQAIEAYTSEPSNYRYEPDGVIQAARQRCMNENLDITNDQEGLKDALQRLTDDADFISQWMNVYSACLSVMPDDLTEEQKHIFSHVCISDILHIDRVFGNSRDAHSVMQATGGRCVNERISIANNQGARWTPARHPPKIKLSVDG